MSLLNFSLKFDKIFFVFFYYFLLNLVNFLVSLMFFLC